MLAAAPPTATCVRTRGRCASSGCRSRAARPGVVVEGGRDRRSPRSSLSGQRGPAIEVADRRRARRSPLDGPGLGLGAPGGADARGREGASWSRCASRGPSGARWRRRAGGAPAARRPGSRTRSPGLWLSRRRRRSWRGWRSAADAGPAIYVAGATLQLRDVRIERARVRPAHRRTGPASTPRACARPGPSAPGSALVQSKGMLEDVHVESAGPLAGVQLIASEIRIQGLEVQGGRSSGLVTRDAELIARGATIVRGPSDVTPERRRRDADPRRPRHARSGCGCRTAAASGCSRPRAAAVS